MDKALHELYEAHGVSSSRELHDEYGDVKADYLEREAKRSTEYNKVEVHDDEI